MKEDNLTILINNYDDMNDEGKNELLVIGEKYLGIKDNTEDKIEIIDLESE